MELHNEMENIVYAQLDGLIEKSAICNCEQCRLDIAALTLNEMKPRYVVTDKGAVFARVTQVDQQAYLDTMTAILTAIELVKKAPRH